MIVCHHAEQLRSPQLKMEVERCKKEVEDFKKECLSFVTLFAFYEGVIVLNVILFI